MTDAELRNLLADCLTLWRVEGRLTPIEGGWAVETADGVYTLRRADFELRPARWMSQTPERAAAGRPERMAPSIVAALSAVRNNLGAGRGQAIRIGGG